MPPPCSAPGVAAVLADTPKHSHSALATVCPPPWGGVRYSTVQYSAVQYSTVQYLGRGSGERLRLARESSWDWRPGLDIGYRQKSAVDISIGLVSVGAGIGNKEALWGVYLAACSRAQIYEQMETAVLCGDFPVTIALTTPLQPVKQSGKHVYECH